MGMVTFLRPRETSNRIWAFGNDTTCTYGAFMVQATTAGIWYQGMLSIYFLLTTRYGMKNATIAKRIELFMHIVAIGYPLCTAIAGAAMGIYGERAGGASCYVRNYDYSSAKPFELQERNIQRSKVIIIFVGIPMVGVALCLAFTQLSIYWFVRTHTRKFSIQEKEDSTPSNKVNISFGCSGRYMEDLSQESSSVPSSKNVPPSNKYKKKNKKQSQRLQLVCSQALLFVISFFLCNVWNLVIIGLQASVKTRADEMEKMVEDFPVLVIQTMMLPIQGFFNCLIFCRPKYLMLRQEFPYEGKRWAVKRIFLGDKLPPTDGAGRCMVGTLVDIVAQQKDLSQSEAADTPVGDTLTSNSVPPARLPRNMLSSLTASYGDFDDDSDVLDEDGRWHDVSPQGNQNSPACFASSRNRTSSLGAISELSESVFDLTPYQANGSHLSVASAGMPAPTEPSESRWKDGSTSAPVTAPPRPALSTVESSEDDLLDGIERRSLKTDSRMEVPRRKCDASADMPIQVPRRTSDVLKVSNDSPISVPKRTSDTPVDPPTRSYSSGSDDPLVLHSEKLTSRHNRLRRKMASDVPLARPSRFVSLPPSEVEGPSGHMSRKEIQMFKAKPMIQEKETVVATAASLSILQFEDGNIQSHALDVEEKSAYWIKRKEKVGFGSMERCPSPYCSLPPFEVEDA
ncbi:unnamed protein product [Cylindrotheca closterium]|uniref:G-protein coupled receptors family 2 profile 2 domain-containing protein n=1 Tax=Cylindrotheca closterium TaxID=2856 RepID=A0AAD2CRW8_9STRA|nr:unnamed protein product [Cylindrotheca closterium]